MPRSAEPGRALRRRPQVRSAAAAAADGGAVRSGCARPCTPRPTATTPPPKRLLVSIEELNRVSLEHHDRVEEQLWIEQLQRLADADDRNPLLSGYACATLLERGLIANEDLAREVSRRLSPGIPADLGAGWFEGLAKRNRYALLARQPLWERTGRLHRNRWTTISSSGPWSSSAGPSAASARRETADLREPRRILGRPRRARQRG